MSSFKYKQLREGDVYEDSSGRIRLHVGPISEGVVHSFPEGAHRAIVLSDPTDKLLESVVYDFDGSSLTLSKLGFKLLYRTLDPKLNKTGST